LPDGAMVLEIVQKLNWTATAVEGQVSAATQNQALSALLFLCQQVLKQELDGRIDAIRAKRPQYRLFGQIGSIR
jgi:hypothetical protein